MPEFQTKLKMTSRLKFWTPAILVAVMISIFSTRYFTGEQTARVIIPVLRWFFPHATPHLLHLMHVGIRKLAHIAEFGLFSITVFHGIRAQRSGWQLNWALSTLLIAVTYAGIDEWHQTFVPLRHATPRDVAIDALGALLAQALVWLYATRKWNFAAPSETSASAAKS
jgi:VanZ family protein